MTIKVTLCDESSSHDAASSPKVITATVDPVYHTWKALLLPRPAFGTYSITA
jgi:hypothetical protein